MRDHCSARGQIDTGPVRAALAGPAWALHSIVGWEEVSDLWRATTPDAVNITDNFSQREFAAALQHLKPGKAPGPDSICPELILYAGAALKSWLRDFISSCLRRLKIPKIWRRALVVAIPKPTKPVGGPKELSTDISALCPLQDPRGAYLRPR